MKKTCAALITSANAACHLIIYSDDDARPITRSRERRSTSLNTQQEVRMANGRVNPDAMAGTQLVPNGSGSYVNSETGRAYAPVGPNAVIDTMTRQVFSGNFSGSSSNPLTTNQGNSQNPIATNSGKVLVPAGDVPAGDVYVNPQNGRVYLPINSATGVPLLFHPIDTVQRLLQELHPCLLSPHVKPPARSLDSTYAPESEVRKQNRIFRINAVGSVRRYSIRTALLCSVAA